MSYIKFLLLFFPLFVGKITTAQQITVGALSTHLSQGFYVGKPFQISRKIESDVSLYYMFNIHKWRVNKQNHEFYKNGYAFNFWQH